jgi:hypothetical protein
VSKEKSKSFAAKRVFSTTAALYLAADEATRVQRKRVKVFVAKRVFATSRSLLSGYR